MLPTRPSGQRGAPRRPESSATEGTPSAPIASRAHMRTLAYSCRRLGTARATAAASSGNRARTAAAESTRVCAALAGAGISSSITPRLCHRRTVAQTPRRTVGRT
ncbi:hypothetical protein DEJ45_06065 [Streptomyces venezuelae]|nr:hypothetical protein DEJ45_06065 [Streptomyces venezuelae]